jgi:trehalose 6-phosphate synthase/phosphatase
MGIDAARFEALAADPDVRTRAAALRREAGGRQIVLGVDRLDYTKGIPRRLQAVERLLTREPALRDRVRYVQVAVPSRGEVDAYQRFRRQVEETVGRINGTCGTLQSTPVHYMHQGVSEQDLAALYCAADVMLVTPLRDGMNLVAKEFVASRIDDDGVLVLSEFAGAAAELDGAIVVNPYDVDAAAARIHDALTMPAAERAGRMRRLRTRVVRHDVHAWAAGFLARMDQVRPARRVPAPLDRAVIASAAGPGPWHLLLDYDGTLVPLAASPDLALPDPELMSILTLLCRSLVRPPAAHALGGTRLLAARAAGAVGGREHAGARLDGACATHPAAVHRWDARCLSRGEEREHRLALPQRGC